MSELKGAAIVQEPLEGELVAYADETLTQPIEELGVVDFGEFVGTIMEPGQIGPPTMNSTNKVTFWLRNESNKVMEFQVDSNNPDVTPGHWGLVPYLKPGDVAEHTLSAGYRGQNTGKISFSFILTGKPSPLQ